MATLGRIPNAGAFELPAKWRRTRLAAVGVRVEQSFGIALTPATPPVAWDELTVAALADWVWSSIESARQAGELPFEAGHVEIVTAALRSLDGNVDEHQFAIVAQRYFFRRGEFRRKWRALGGLLGVTLPKPEASLLGFFVCLPVSLALLAFCLFGVLSVVGANRWMATAVDVVFVPLVLLAAWQMAKLTVVVWPATPESHNTVCKLAMALAREHPMSRGNPNVWTEALVSEKVRELIAGAFKVPLTSVIDDSRLVALGS